MNTSLRVAVLAALVIAVGCSSPSPREDEYARQKAEIAERERELADADRAAGLDAEAVEIAGAARRVVRELVFYRTEEYVDACAATERACLVDSKDRRVLAEAREAARRVYLERSDRSSEGCEAAALTAHRLRRDSLVVEHFEARSPADATRDRELADAGEPVESKKDGERVRPSMTSELARHRAAVRERAVKLGLPPEEVQRYVSRASQAEREAVRSQLDAKVDPEYSRVVDEVRRGARLHALDRRVSVERVESHAARRSREMRDYEASWRAILAKRPELEDAIAKKRANINAKDSSLLLALIPIFGDTKRIGRAFDRAGDALSLPYLERMLAETSPEYLTRVELQRDHPRLLSTGEPFGVTASSDGSQVLVGGQNGIVFRDAKTHDVVRVLDRQRGALLSLAVSRDGGLALLGGQRSIDEGDTVVRVLDTRTGALVSRLVGHETPVISGALAPTGKLAFTGDKGRTIVLWDVAQATQRWKHYAFSRAAAFSPDSKLIASVQDLDIALLDASQGKTVGTISNSAARGPQAVAFSPDGRWLATGWENGEIEVHDLEKKTTPRTAKKSDGAVTSVRFSPDGTRLAWGQTDGSIGVASFQEGNLGSIQSASGPPSKGWMPEKYWVNVAFAPGGAILAAYPDPTGERDAIISLREPR